MRPGSVILDLVVEGDLLLWLEIGVVLLILCDTVPSLGIVIAIHYLHAGVGELSGSEVASSLVGLGRESRIPTITSRPSWRQLIVLIARAKYTIHLNARSVLEPCIPHIFLLIILVILLITILESIVSRRICARI